MKMLTVTEVGVVKRHGWIFFADLNSRFVTLIEECGHLQETIFGLLPDTIDNYISFGTCSDASAERAWRNPDGYITACREKDIYSYFDQETTTLAALCEWLGSLVVGLTANQTAWTKDYADLVREVTVTNPNASLKFYWFISKRAFFLNAAISTYTKHVEFAHEKLVQILETRPGSVPNPILFRRWNSALYEDFLAAYSRHARWVSGQFIDSFRKPEDAPENERDDYRPCINHGWAHQTTSTVVHHGLSGTSTLYGTIQSPFFYLEQPILFPLLYHELAHLEIARHDKQTEGARAQEHVANIGSLQARTFWQTRKNIEQLCRDYLAKHLDARRDFEYIQAAVVELDELWADAMAIRLCGVPYVVAQVLQLFGICGSERFAEPDGVLLDKLGTAKNAPGAPILGGFYWPARLSAAIQFAQVLNATNDDKSTPDAVRLDIEWLNSLELILEVWWDGYQESLLRDAPSAFAISTFNLRDKANENFHKVWTDVVLGEEFLSEWDAAYVQNDNYSMHRNGDADEPFREARNVVRKAVERYLANTAFLGSQSQGGADRLWIDRVESCLIEIRWLIAGVIQESSKDDESSLSGERLNAFSNYVRHDGNTGFRIVMEWLIARDGLYESMYAEDFKDLIEKVATVARSKGVEIEEFLASCPEQKMQLVDWLSFRRYDNPKRLAKPYDKLRVIQNAINDYVAKRSIDAAKWLGDWGDESEAPVGMAILGSIRPQEFGMYGKRGSRLKRHPTRTSNDALRGYELGFDLVRNYYSRQFESLSKKIAISGRAKGTISYKFSRLLGDYSFMVFTKGATPTERCTHPFWLPKTLTKQRFVFQVFNSSGNTNISDHEKKLPVCRISLLKFRRRSQWIGVRAKLEGYTTDTSAQMFLSTGWEDVILITRHGTIDESNALFNSLSITPTSLGGIDIQTCFVLDDMGEPSSTSQEEQSDVQSESRKATCSQCLTLTSDTWFEAAAALLRTRGHRILNTMGRYDYVIWWNALRDTHDNHLSIAPAEIDNELRFLPCWFWDYVGTFATTYQWTDDDGGLMRYISRVVHSGPATSKRPEVPESCKRDRADPV